MVMAPKTFFSCPQEPSEIIVPGNNDFYFFHSSKQVCLERVLNKEVKSSGHPSLADLLPLNKQGE